jgi:phage baseplate assembly protein W
MARLIPKKFPDDLEERQTIGFDFPLNGNAVFNPTTQTKDQIKANLINYLLTNTNERVFNPNFGANLRNILFESIDTSIEELQDRVQRQVNSLFPEVQIQDLQITPFPDENSISLEIKYIINILNIEDDVTIIVQ